MNIVIHAGMDKTGTTFLQAMLNKNRHILQKHSILYTTLLHQCKNAEFINKKYMTNFLDTYIDIAEYYNVKTLLLSEESLYTNKNFIYNYNFPKNCNITFIIYVRLIPSQTESMIKQKLKNKYTFDNIFKNNSDRFPKIYRIINWHKYINEFMQEGYIQCKFFSYEKSKKHCLASHFLSQLGLNNDDFDCDVPQIRRNISPSTYDSLFLNFIKALPIQNYEMEYFVNYFKVRSISSDKTQYIFFNQDYYYELLKKNYVIFETLGRKMHYVDYIEDSLQWLEGKELCPHTVIPKEKFQEILDKLPPMLQDIITKYLPPQTQVYDSIKKIDEKDVLPAYLSQASTASPSAYVSLDTMLDLAVQHPFDTSMCTQPIFFGEHLERYANHLSSVKFNANRTSLHMKYWGKAYRKLLCIELMRVFFDRKYYHIFFDDRRYTNEYLTELLKNRVIFLHERYVFDNITKTEGNSVIFFGGGSIFMKYLPYFTTHKILGICIDIDNPPRMINGIPVFHPDGLLPGTDGQTPVFIFSREAPAIKQRLEAAYPHCRNIITCCF